MLNLLSQLRGKKTRRKAAPAADLLAAQNFPRGTVFALLAAVISMTLWVYIALIFDRYFPWVSVLQGFVIGIAMQRFGNGLDWRFPTIAAAITAAAAVAGSFLVALFLTGREFGTGALTLVDEISLHTVIIFLTRDFGIVGLVYLAFAAALSGFFANRRLLAGEAAALRRHAVNAASGKH